MASQPLISTNATRASLLVRLHRDGPAREVAWAEFHDLYAPIISGFARRFGARAEDADDLVQEVLRAFFSIAPEFRYDPTQGRFRGYLKTCVWRKWSDLQQKRGREVGALGKLLAAEDEAVESAWNDVWETEKLHRAMEVVRARYAVNTERERTFRAFEMCAILDRSPEQVAKDLGMSVESVRTAKSRVSKALREEFETLDEKTG